MKTSVVILVFIKPLMTIVRVFKRETVDNIVKNKLSLVQDNDFNKKEKQ